MQPMIPLNQKRERGPPLIALNAHSLRNRSNIRKPSKLCYPAKSPPHKKKQTNRQKYRCCNCSTISCCLTSRYLCTTEGVDCVTCPFLHVETEWRLINLQLITPI